MQTMEDDQQKLYFSHRSLLFMMSSMRLNVQFVHKQFCLVTQWAAASEGAWKKSYWL
jgi:hypothetical protein